MEPEVNPHFLADTVEIWQAYLVSISARLLGFHQEDNPLI
jgi:hypothetical protein